MSQHNDLVTAKAFASSSLGTSAPPVGGSHILRGLLVSVVLLLCIGAAALGMVQPAQPEPIPPEQSLVQNVLPFPLEANPTPAEHDATAVNAPYVTETRIRSGDTIATILKRLDIADSSLSSYLVKEPKVRFASKLVPGRSVQAATDHNGQLKWVRYFHTPTSDSIGQPTVKLLQINATDDGFSAEELELPSEVHIEVAVGTIERSLFATTDAAGIPDGITMQIAEVLGSKIDFFRGIHRGDQFRVVYENRSFEGRPAGPGRVLAVEFVSKGKSSTAVWFSPEGQAGSYYDLEGESLRGAFLRNSIKFSRISSTFGMRNLTNNQAWSGHHPGVDYAAPTGTPIHATADGVVQLAGWHFGYGNTIILKHHSKITTLYGHQSRFAEGITVGTKVSQGQLIGYVGSTGWSTGAHLHYEFRVADKPIDPLSATAAMPASTPLEPEQRAQFAQAAAPYRQQLQVLAKFQEFVPEISSVAVR
ncbi:MAG: peptidoglycan DD-metalloendopeptidase family protein [Alcaligenaceae bacterium]